MIDSIGGFRPQGLENLTKRMTEIANYADSLKGKWKPEMVSHFEAQLQEAMRTGKEAKELNSFHTYHPFLAEDHLSGSLEKEGILETEKVENSPEQQKEQRISKKIKEVSKKYCLPERLLHAVIQTESNYDPYAVSRAGAMGLMQLMPKTALEMGVTKPFDIEQNIEGGAKYLKMMLEKYSGDMEKSLAAYNAGPMRVDQSNGIPEIEETQNYVKKITALLSQK